MTPAPSATTEPSAATEPSADAAPAATAASAAVQERITAYWDGRAPSYAADQQRQVVDAPLRDAWHRAWASGLPTAPSDVLDLGTGTGQVARVLAELGHRVTGTDLSEGMLTHARRGTAHLDPAPRFLVGDAIAPAFPEASFDAVTARWVLWTLHDPAAALVAWRRLLRPGGRLAVVDSTWFPDGLHTPRVAGSTPDAFQRHYDREVVDHLPLAEADAIDATVAAVTAAGFVDVEVTALTEIAALERARQGDPDHEGRLQFLITATAPDA
ncbi:class I SAM-dependent methyltransferase [Nitriliruptoraceae bacterium ZYF776]|nr:class I SAM-dependent methyltransferase [Profundirhabdus halotolerans]